MGVTILSVFVGLAVAFSINDDHIFPHLRGVTNKGGYEEVWLSAMRKGWSLWAEITDYKNNLRYIGWIEQFSEGGELREILLRDVEIFELKPKKYLSKTPAIYLTFKENFTIKFIAAPYYEEPQRSEKDNAESTAAAATEAAAAAAEAAATTTITETSANANAGGTGDTFGDK